ncbi:phage tail tape measure protein [Crenobacter caeni]|uniref:Phage tail tape measure protein n=1 Tax=Crenobacter caeni TaxID=2705474 RepID=A0A6B2KNE2_9NEIS|nr:phage tail tape measure protein [Crenobacter caeni]NDV11678.1 phage tail tape measure protein [Crenobacter caeni]
MADKFQLKALITGVDQLSPKLDGIRKNVASLRKSLRQSGMAEIDFGAVAAVTAPLVGAVKAAIDFESSMADVRKVVDFDTPQQFAQMSDEIREMSLRLPMAAKDIAAIYAQGGSAGIARSELQGFADDAVKMGVAFGLTAQESGEQMAAWRASMGLTQDGVRALSDQINYLDAAGNSSAKNVAAVVTRVGAIGKVAGLSSGTVAALAATMDAVKVPSDVAATGIKNFVLALTQGNAATKSQKETLQALRLDASKVAQSMQVDSKGTVLDILQRIKSIDPSKQASVLSELFGKESIEAIAPFLSNLDMLKTNLLLVGDSTGYAGSMQKEFDLRAQTTANSLQLFWNRITDVGIAVGSVLLPPLNEFMAVVGPMITSMSSMAAANPWLIKGLLGAGAAVLGLRVAGMALVGALNLANMAMRMSPIGMFAMAAGFVVANWKDIGPFFSRMWAGIRSVFDAGVGFVKTYLGWTPLGVVLNNWEPLKAFFSALWGGIKLLFDVAWQGIKFGFENFTPLGLLIKNWEPIVAYFKSLWEKVRPIIEPLMGAAKGFGGAVSGAAGRALNAGTSVIKGATQAARAELTVNLNNAPAGTRVERPATSNTRLTVNQNTGRRSLAPTSN